MGEYKGLPFKPEQYKGEFNLLRAERELIVIALSIVDGNIAKAHKILCPEENPAHSRSGFYRAVRQHQIKDSEWRGKTEFTLTGKRVKVKRKTKELI